MKTFIILALVMGVVCASRIADEIYRSAKEGIIQRCRDDSVGKVVEWIKHMNDTKINTMTLSIELDQIQCADTGVSRLEMLVAHLCLEDIGFYVMCNTSRTKMIQSQHARISADGKQVDPPMVPAFDLMVWAFNPDVPMNDRPKCACPMKNG